MINGQNETISRDNALPLLPTIWMTMFKRGGGLVLGLGVVSRRRWLVRGLSKFKRANVLASVAMLRSTLPSSKQGNAKLSAYSAHQSQGHRLVRPRGAASTPSASKLLWVGSVSAYPGG